MTIAVLLTRDEGPLRFRPPSLDGATCEQIFADELDVYQQAVNAAARFTPAEQQAFWASEMTLSQEMQQFVDDLQDWMVTAFSAKSSAGCTEEAWCRAMEAGVGQLRGSGVFRDAVIAWVHQECSAPGT